jgi:hypothetical protein
MGIAPIQYGSRSDKHIVRLDPTVSAIRTGWYKDVEWEYQTIAGEVRRGRGIYLMCDGGYLRWKTLMCPYAGTPGPGCRHYYNKNLESVRKDVECTYGILKKCWRILDFGIHYSNMKFCEKIFTVCCVLHNMLLDLPEGLGFGRIWRVGRGALIEGDGLWLEGPRDLARRFVADTTIAALTAEDHSEGIEWMERREQLADRIEFCKSLNR